MKTLTILLTILCVTSCSDRPNNHADDVGAGVDMGTVDTTIPDLGPVPDDMEIARTDAADLQDVNVAPVPTRIHLKNLVQGDIAALTTFTFQNIDGEQVEKTLLFSEPSTEQYIVNATDFTISVEVAEYPAAGGTHSLTLEPDTLNTVVFVGTNVEVPQPTTPPNDVTPRFLVIPGERTVDFPLTKELVFLHASADAPPILSFSLDGEEIPEFAGLHFGEASSLISTSGQGQLGRLEFEDGVTREFYIPSEFANTASVLEIAGLLEPDHEGLFFLPFGGGRWEIGTENQQGIKRPTPVQVINVSGSTTTVEYTPDWVLADALSPRNATPTGPAPHGEFGVLLKEGAGAGSFAQIQLPNDRSSRHGIVLYEVAGNRRIGVGSTTIHTVYFEDDERQIVVFNATTAPVEVSVDGETQTVEAESFTTSRFEFSNPTPTIVLPTGSGEVVDLSANLGECLTLVIDDRSGIRGLLVDDVGNVTELLP